MDRDQEICANCYYSRWDSKSEDFVCNNPESEYFADWTEYQGYCSCFENRYR